MHTPEGEQDDSRPYAEPAPKTEASNRGHFEDHLSALRDANAGAAVTVWKDGSWQAWQTLDAKYAEGDPNWLCTIPFSDAIGDAFDIVRATALAAARHATTSAGWGAALRNPPDDFIIAVGCNPDNGQFPQSDGRYWRVVFAKIANYLAVNKPQGISPARDPVALLLAEAERLRAVPYVDTEFYTDHQERQRLARSYQDAAELLEKGPR